MDGEVLRGQENTGLEVLLILDSFFNLLKALVHVALNRQHGVFPPLFRCMPQFFIGSCPRTKQPFLFAPLFSTIFHGCTSTPSPRVITALLPVSALFLPRSVRSGLTGAMVVQGSRDQQSNETSWEKGGGESGMRLLNLNQVGT